MRGIGKKEDEEGCYGFFFLLGISVNLKTCSSLSKDAVWLRYLGNVLKEEWTFLIRQENC